jgi:hypothetical protein
VFCSILDLRSNGIFDPHNQLIHSTDFTAKDTFLYVTPVGKPQGQPITKKTSVQEATVLAKLPQRCQLIFFTM